MNIKVYIFRFVYDVEQQRFLQNPVTSASKIDSKPPKNGIMSLNTIIKRIDHLINLIERINRQKKVVTMSSTVFFEVFCNIPCYKKNSKFFMTGSNEIEQKC